MEVWRIKIYVHNYIIKQNKNVNTVKQTSIHHKTENKKNKHVLL